METVRFLLNFILCQITFVHHQNGVEIVATNNLTDILQPPLNVVFGPLIIDRADQHDTVSASIIILCNGSEPFLSRSVPDLDFDGLFISDHDTFELEIHSDRGDKFIREDPCPSKTTTEVQWMSMRKCMKAHTIGVPE